MTEGWILMVLLASGDMQVIETPTELACDLERQAIADVIARDESCPVAIAAQCVQALVERDR